MDIEKVFFSLTSSLPYPVLVTDGNPEDPRIIFANMALETMTGYGLEELRGKSPRIFQGERTDPKVLGRLKESLRQRKPFKGTTYNYRKSGEAYFLKWCIRPFSAEGTKFFVAIQQELNEENSDDQMRLDHDFVVSLLRNLTAFYRNSISIYQHFHQRLREGDYDDLHPSEMIDTLQIRDSLSLAASDLADYLISPDQT